MRRSLKILPLLLTLAMSFTATQSYAFGLFGESKLLKKDVQRMRLNGGSRAVAPFAHVVFCVHQPEDCQTTSGATSVDVSKGNKFAELEEVNRRVNHAIKPRSDASNLDQWSLAPRYGDCEDYAITKRHELIRRGWPSGALRLAEALTQTGEGHLVLVVSTSKGDMVLDNLRNKILPWSKTGLRWKMIQAQYNPKIWLHLW